MHLRASDFPNRPFADATAHLRDDAALRALAQRDGYAFFPELLPRDRVARVRARVRELCATWEWFVPDPANPPVVRAAPGARMAGRGWDDPRFVELQRAMGGDPDFLALVQSPPLLAALAAAAGEPMALATANHCWVKLPGSPEHTTRPHQDLYYLPACPRLWTAWIPLVETPMEVGPLGVVRGSHHGPLWPQVDPFAGIDVGPDVQWDTEPCGPGSVVIFDAGTVHCAWSNVSPELVRVSLDVRYDAASLGDESLLRPDAGLRR